MSKDIIRRCRFSPYRKGRGPVFTLVMWDAHARDERGQTVIGYRLSDNYVGTIFEGEDFAGSPMHADDSDSAVAALMGFLTLRPGDTDEDYFAKYTDSQLGFAYSHAERLACEVENRFGER